MVKRGTTRLEVEETIQKGKKTPAKEGRLQYEYNFVFDGIWGKKKYAMKKVLAIVAEEDDFLEVVTIYTMFF
jgi:hypothetical protein